MLEESTLKLQSMIKLKIDSQLIVQQTSKGICIEGTLDHQECHNPWECHGIIHAFWDWVDNPETSTIRQREILVEFTNQPSWNNITYQHDDGRF